MHPIKKDNTNVNIKEKVYPIKNNFYLTNPRDSFTDLDGTPSKDKRTQSQRNKDYFHPIKGAWERWKSSIDNGTNPIHGIKNTVVPALEGTAMFYGGSGLYAPLKLMRFRGSTPIIGGFVQNLAKGASNVQNTNTLAKMLTASDLVRYTVDPSYDNAIQAGMSAYYPVKSWKSVIRPLQKTINDVMTISDWKDDISSFQQGGLIDLINRTNKKDVNFINRLKDPNRKFIPDWSNKNKIATHKMSWATDANNRAIIYPDVQEVNGELIDYTNPKYGKWDGFKQALLSGDTIQTNIDLAKQYTNNGYKKFYPNFK